MISIIFPLEFKFFRKLDTVFFNSHQLHVYSKRSKLNFLPSKSNDSHSGFDQKTEIRNSVCGMTIKWNWVIQFDILSGGGGEGRGICENSRLEFGKTFSNHLKYQLLSTKKNWINEMKHFHSQNWKQKDIKKKDIVLQSYNLFNQTVS